MRPKIALVAITLPLLAGCGDKSGSSSKSSSGQSAENKVQPPPSNVPEKIDNASVTMGGVTGNGLSAKQLMCSGSGNALTMVGNVAGLSTQKDALEACVKKPENPRVHWTSKEKKTSDIRVADASSPEVARCIADAIAKVSVDLDVTCIATLELGADKK
ncbi:MAG: hypothetical protein U0271_41080 [Polyangiaceae bacterium]